MVKILEAIGAVSSVIMAFLLEIAASVERVEPAPSSASLSASSPAYGDADYWHERYAATSAPSSSSSPPSYEWLLSWVQLKSYLEPELQGRPRILHPGCGSSTLGTDLRESGFGGELTMNSDISPAVIEQMQRLHPECVYVVDDALSMSAARRAVCGNFEEEEDVQNRFFDCVLDKGTLDAFACTTGTQAEKRAVVHRYLNEVRAILDPANGRFLCISFGQPETRKHYFPADEWRTLKVQPIVVSRSPQKEEGEDSRGEEADGDGGSTAITEKFFLYVLAPIPK